jgi:hypothetical protein
MKRNTFVLRTEKEALFLSDYGFDTYDIIETDEEGVALNKRDITAWFHEIKDHELDGEIVFCRCEFDEFKRLHAEMYEKWKEMPHGWRSDEEKKRIDDAQDDLVAPLHEWLEKHPVDEETQMILRNEVYKDYCPECDKYVEEEDIRYIEELGESCCADCALSKIKSKYDL